MFKKRNFSCFRILLTMGRKLPKTSTNPNTRDNSQNREVDDDARSIASNSTASTMITVNINRIHQNQENPPKSRRIPLASKQRCRTGGRRGQRREEHTRELTKIYEEMRNEEDDSGFIKFIEPSETKFSKVLEDPELRKTWQVFTSLPGDAQDRFINYIDKSMSDQVEFKQARTAESVSLKKMKIDDKAEDDVMNDSAVDLGETYSFVNKDGEVVEECDRLREARRCYMNVQKKIRNNMRKEGKDRVPFGLIEDFEKNLIKHFSDDENLENSIPFIQEQPNAYNRTWIHRICDYYSLTSKTEEGAIFIKYCSSYKVPSIGFGEFLRKVL